MVLRIGPPAVRHAALRSVVAVAVVGGLTLVAACSSGGGAPRPVAAPSFLVEDLGGATTARALRGRPVNQSARNLDNNGLARFAAGAEPFDQRLEDPTSEGPFDPAALGPSYISDGCLGCHLDGTSPHTPSDRDEPPGLIARISAPGGRPGAGPTPVVPYGLELQTHSTAGPPEARVALDWKATTAALADGDLVSLRSPRLRVSELSEGPLPSGTLTSLRIATPIVGLGLLEAIPESDLRAAAAQQARDGVVSGRVNEVWDDLAGRLAIGRFGWKAGQPSVRQQTAHALFADMGVVSDDSNHRLAADGSQIAPSGPSEISASVFSDLVFYNRTIAVPVARDVADPAVGRGAHEFVDAGCASCHTPTQRSGADEITALADQTFHPYTDLLLHDMGPGLADGRPEFAASGAEWRTAPLWGLGRRVQVLGFANFLHDGRARTVTEAIMWHQGEAAASRAAFERLDAGQRADLLRFLNSL